MCWIFWIGSQHQAIHIPDGWGFNQLEKQEARSYSPVNSRSWICCVSKCHTGGIVDHTADDWTQGSTTRDSHLDFRRQSISDCYMTKNPQYHGRSKHLSIKFHFIWDQVSKGSVQVISYLWHAKDRFEKLREKMGLTKCSGEWGGVMEQCSTRTQFNVLF